MIGYKKVKCSGTRVIVLLLFVALLSSCAMTPARRMVDEGDVRLDLSLSGTLAESEFTPVIPNLSLGLAWGVTEGVNVGLSVSPGLLPVKNTLIAEPYLAVNALESRGIIPEVNAYLILPSVLSLQEMKLRSYPLAGILGRFDTGNFGWYVAGEAVLDRNWTDDSPLVRYNLRGGVDYAFDEGVSLGVEAGMNRIGESSVLYGWKSGQPVVRMGMFMTP